MAPQSQKIKDLQVNKEGVVGGPGKDINAVAVARINEIVGRVRFQGAVIGNGFAADIGRRGKLRTDQNVG